MNRFNIIFLIIFITFILPGPPNSPINSDDQYNKLQIFKSHLYDSYENLKNLTFKYPTSNLTGFMLSYQDSLDGLTNQSYPILGKDYDHWANNQSYSILPDEITNEALKIWNLEQNEPINPNRNYYSNISTYTNGVFNRINNTFINLPLQLPKYLENFAPDLNNPNLNPNPSSESSDTKIENYDKKVVGNITFDTGPLKLDLTVIDNINGKYFNQIDEKIKFISLDAEIMNFDETESHSIYTKGFYFVETGNILTATNSAKFFSLYGGLQHLTFTEDNLESSKNLTLTYLKETFFKSENPKENFDLNFNYLTQFLETSQDHCEYLSYFHIDKVNLTNKEINDIDQELLNPIGRPIDFEQIPKLKLNGFFYSPDCSIKLVTENSIGIKKEVFLFKLHKISIFGIVLLLSQIVLILKQMNFSNTPSTISRISFWSICLMSIVDGSLTIIYLISSAVLNKLYLPLTVSAFLAFILTSIFEMRFMINIYVAQFNERSINLFTALQGRPLDNDNNTDDNNNNNNNTEVIEPTQNESEQPSQVDESQISGTIYSRFFFSVIIFTFLILNATIWSKNIRQTFERVMLFILNSYWWPQVYRNVVKGSHRSFQWWFVIGTTLIRTTPIFYLFASEKNIFNHHTDIIYFITLMVWIASQILVLSLQAVFGARFFLPKSIFPQTYNYHPLLTSSDLENGYGLNENHFHEEQEAEEDIIGTSTSNPKIRNLENGHHCVDCAICMNEVEIPIAKSNLDQATSFLQRRAYMVTPCRHIFHSQCLEAWMKYKLQCPVCRTSLPPL